MKDERLGIITMEPWQPRQEAQLLSVVSVSANRCSDLPDDSLLYFHGNHGYAHSHMPDVHQNHRSHCYCYFPGTLCRYSRTLC